MIKFSYKGDYSKTRKFLNRNKKQQFDQIIEQYAYEGLRLLKEATPKNTGDTASKWEFEVNHTATGAEIVYTNSSANKGIPIVILLQYGHATNGGGYVKGIDFINPTIKPLFDKIVDTVWTEVTK